jgi:hypothetical protein
MKEKLNSSLFYVFILFLIACGGKDTPRSVGEKFLNSMNSGDFEDAKKYGTEETGKLLDMMSGFAKMAVDSVKKETKFEILRESIEGDKATVFYKEEGREGELQLPMVKSDGKWKVLLNKESINNADDYNMDTGATSLDSTAK